MPKQNRFATGIIFHISWVAIVLTAGMGPAVLNYIIDPYEMFRRDALDKQSAEISEKAHYPLWKMTHFPKDSTTVILGDSRARALRNKYWRELGLKDVYNFAYGGGTIPEIYSTFQSIKDNPNLTTLIVGIQLRSFDVTHKGGMNRVPEAIRVSQNAISYLKNWSVAKTSAKLSLRQNPKFAAFTEALSGLLSNSAQAAELGKPGALSIDRLLTPEICFGCDLPEDGETYLPIMQNTKGVNLGLGRGNRSKNHSISYAYGYRQLPTKFDRQVLRNAKADWKNFQFSEQYFNLIKELADWANADVKRTLLFVIPPTIPEMQATIEQYGLGQISAEMRSRLAALAPVVDFDFPNSMTKDLENFSDAYHFNAKIARAIAGEISILVSNGSADIQAKALKRRTALACPSLQKIAPSKTQNLTKATTPQACRIWKGASNDQPK